MKSKILYMVTLGAACMMAGCSEDLTYPPMVVPHATQEPNTTIAEFKQLYWQNAKNYCSNVLEKSDGVNMVIKGRVVSSDATGNVFKNVVIEDQTAAITVAINAYDLNQSYQYGQELVVNVTGLQVGGYNGLMQLGGEGTYNNAPSMTFMTKELFDQHAEPDGLAQPDKVVPTVYTIPQLTEIKGNQEQLCVTQSRLVKVENVHFVDAGQAFAPNANTDRYVMDEAGNRLNVRCSSYATFKNDLIPTGTGSVTGILSYYGSDWQMILNDTEGLEGFTPADPSVSTGSEPKGSGTAEDPYNVAKAIEVAQANGETSDVSVYTAGYVISGSIDTSYGNGTWTICDSKDGAGSQMTVYRAKDYDNQKFTDANKVKVGDLIVVYAPVINFKGNTPETNMGYLYSINGATGGSTPDTPDTPATGEGSESSPYSVAAVQAGATGAGVWVKGYIVGYVDGKVLDSDSKFTGTATANTNILLADSPDASATAQVIPVQLPSGAVRSAINLQDNPGNYKREVMLKGSLEKYFGVAGLKTVTEYKFTDGGGSTPDTPTPSGDYVYSGLATGLDGWTINNVVIPADLSYVWQWDASYGCLKASAYKSQNYATDAYITTTLDLTAYKAASVAFDHAYKFGADIQQSLTLVAREAGATAWTTLTIPTWPTGQDWTFVNSGDVDLKAFAGKKVEIGFRYTSTDSAAATWEIKNFNVSATK